MRLDVMKVIEEWRKKIPKKYNLYTDDLCVINNNLPDRIEFGRGLFVLGYARGYKAAQKDILKDRNNLFK